MKIQESLRHQDCSVLGTPRNLDWVLQEVCETIDTHVQIILHEFVKRLFVGGGGSLLFNYKDL